MPQIGIVQIDDDVEIGANTTIDRARFGRTWIQEGVKIDNLVQIAHNVVIGKHSIIVAQVGIAGSVRIGSGVVIGGQAGIIGHIEIDDGTMIGAQSGVSKSLHGGTWWATPTVPLKEAKEQLAWVRRLGTLFERVKALEEKLRKSPNECEALAAMVGAGLLGAISPRGGSFTERGRSFRCRGLSPSVPGESGDVDVAAVLIVGTEDISRFARDRFAVGKVACLSRCGRGVAEGFGSVVWALAMCAAAVRSFCATGGVADGTYSAGGSGSRC